MGVEQEKHSTDRQALPSPPSGEHGTFGSATSIKTHCDRLDTLGPLLLRVHILQEITGLLIS